MGPGDFCQRLIATPHRIQLLENLEPRRRHWFGTDDSGRDVLSRMIHGARISLSVVAVGIALVIGIWLGALAGYFGGWLDQVISRIIEILLTIPTFFLIITIIAFLPPSIYNIMVVIGLTGWTGVARFVRAEFLKLKRLDFVLASRALGASHARIIFLHMLPNAMAPVLVSAVFGIAGAILTESSLSFLGFGVPPPTPSWGDILSQSRDYIEFAWWLTTFPGIAIFLSITAYNLVGEGLRDAMDPKLFN
jgi:peptide/nickel transport system permease protein